MGQICRDTRDTGMQALPLPCVLRRRKLTAPGAPAGSLPPFDSGNPTPTADPTASGLLVGIIIPLCFVAAWKGQRSESKQPLAQVA